MGAFSSSLGAILYFAQFYIMFSLSPYTPITVAQPGAPPLPSPFFSTLFPLNLSLAQDIGYNLTLTLGLRFSVFDVFDVDYGRYFDEER